MKKYIQMIFTRMKKQAASQFNIRYIVVHTTGTTGVRLNELDELPFHYLITKSGKLVNVKPLQPTDGTIEIALSGGLDRRGSHIDERTSAQNKTLFCLLLTMGHVYDEAIIKGADELYPFAYANPGFNVRQWMHDYAPQFVLSAYNNR